MLDQLETEIAGVLEEVLTADKQSGGISDREWTRRIKESLCMLGQRNRYGVCAAGCAGADEGEWLFDMVSTVGRGDPWQFCEMPLAMECEWSTHLDDIAWDFEKLLVAKAQHKLFIFQEAAQSGVREVAERLKAMVNSFKTTLPGERYLLAGYAFDEHRFHFGCV